MLIRPYTIRALSLLEFTLKISYFSLCLCVLSTSNKTVDHGTNSLVVCGGINKISWLSGISRRVAKLAFGPRIVKDLLSVRYPSESGATSLKLVNATTSKTEVGTF